MPFKTRNIYPLAILWLRHYLIYYIMLAFLLNTIATISKERPFTLETAIATALAPAVAIIGFYDGLPIIIPFLANFLFLEKFSVFRSYIITGTICFFTVNAYIVFIADSPYHFLNRDGSKTVVNNFLLIIPALALTYAANWALFSTKTDE